MRLGIASRRVSAVLLLMALALPVSAGPVAAGGSPGECAELKPLSQVHKGDTGEGWTVERGTTPERFLFEVLGIVDDGIAPGRDLIIVEVSDAPGNDMISRAGGIWAGMSGSPVYLGGKLLGAVAYGFTFGPSPIGGVTPAVDMADVLGYSTGAAAQTRDRVAVPQSMRAEVAARAGTSEAQASQLERLRIPFAVSGLNARARDNLEKMLKERGINAIVTSTARSARSAGTVISGRPVPGGNFAGAASYGDVTLAGIGTATYVCGNKALAFGHPLAFMGSVAFGANNADAIAVIDDPTATPFKMANITGLFGKLDHDRLTAIRAKLNATPTLRAITSHVENVDTGFSRNGRSDATMNVFVPVVAPNHLLANADVVFDQIGPGTAMVTWTIKGKRANGNPWSLEYTNRYASSSDITFESVFQMADQLAVLESNPFEAIKFTSVDIDASYNDTFTRYDIESVKISKNGGLFRERSSLNVSPGDQLRARVSLRRYRSTVTTVDLQVNVPNDATPGSFGLLAIFGGGDIFADPGGGVNSFPQLVAALENTPRNDDVIAQLLLDDFEGGSSVTSDSERLNAVVGGGVEIGISVE